jgi:hypothetical protein
MTKHSWTKDELITVCVCYIEKVPIEKALELTGTTDETSMKMRYQNCLFLHKGKVEGSLSHASKLHQEAWKDVQTVYSTVLKVRKEDDYLDTMAMCGLGIGMTLCLLLSVYAMLLI